MAIQTTTNTTSNIDEPLTSAAVQEELKGIMNFRDLGESAGTRPDGTKYMRDGLIFRSATLDGANEIDVQLLINRYKLMTIVDLRTSVEKDKNKKQVEMSFPTAVLMHINPKDLVVPSSTKLSNNDQGKRQRTITSAQPEKPCSSVSYIAPVKSEMVHGRRTFRIDFAGKNFQRQCVWGPCPISVKAQALAFILLCQKPRAIRLIGKTFISPRGLKGMYQDFVEGCREEIVATLKIFADSQNYPILVHCSQGKDRTGMISALLLSIIGVPEEVIARDYARSERGLESIHRETVEFMARSGLGPEFANAPEEAMLHTLRYITSRYGSVTDFLTAIGFDELWQERVRHILIPERERA